MITFKNIFISILFLGMSVLIACTSEQIDQIDCNITGPSITVATENIIHANCAPNGSLTATGSGGVGELKFSIDGVMYQASPTFGGLSAGQYSITVSDENDCKAVATAQVQNTGNDLSATGQPSAAGGCGTNEGMVTVNASGGAGGYTYRLGNGDFVETNVFDNLSGGSHNFTVKDSEECTISIQVNLLSGVSWSQTIKPIFDLNCSIATCHGEDKTIPDWSVFANVKNNASAIKTATKSGIMPQNGQLTQNQIDLIACWVDDGAPAN